MTLNNPQKLNAFSVSARVELARAFDTIGGDDSVRVLVITGAGRGFCSGADIAGQKARLEGDHKPATQKELLQPTGYWGRALAALEKPTIAAVNGVAAGAGLSLAMLCDIRFASEEAKFAFSFVKRGLVPDTGATYTAPRLLGLSKAYELMYTGEPVDAQEAKQIGLVSRVLPADRLLPEAMGFAGKLATGPPIALQLIKRAVKKGLHGTLDEQFFFESYAQGICRATQDHREGVNAFMEKRPPVFRGQ